MPALAPLAVWLEALRLDRVLAPGDGLTYYLPVQVLAARAWRSGVVPSWDQWSFAGSPLLATGQVGVFYPPNLVHLVLRPDLAHDLLVVLAFVIAGTGAALLGRRLTGDPVAGAVCGLTFGLSGFLFGHLNHLSISATACWLPWALLGLERLLRPPSDVAARAEPDMDSGTRPNAAVGALAPDRVSAAVEAPGVIAGSAPSRAAAPVRGGPSPLRVLGAAAPIAAAALAGHPQVLLVVVAVVGLWAAGVAMVEHSPRALLLGALGVAGGLALGAVQLIPLLAHLGDSDRTSLTFDQAMSWSFGPRESLLLVFPHLFGSQGGSGPFTAAYGGDWSLTELSGYVGAAALVLAGAGLAGARRAQHLLPLALVAALAVLVALGDSTPFGRLVHALPVVGQLRSWGRATVAIDLVVAVLAAHGVAAVRSGSPGARRAAAIVAAALCPLAVVGLLLPQAAGGAPGRWAVVLPLAAAALVLAAVRLPRRALGGALVVIVGLDMVMSFGWWHRWREQSPTTAQVAAALDGDVAPRWGPVPDAPGGIERVALDVDDPLDALPDAPRTTSAKGIRTVGGYDPLAPAAYLDAVGLDYRGAVDPSSDLLDGRSHLADLLRVTWVVDRDVTGHPRAAALPEAFLVGEAVAASHEAALAGARGDTGLDPAATVLVEGCSACSAADEAGPAGTVGPVRWGPSSATVVVDARRPAVLVLSQAWAQGWSATVDGRPAPVVRADGIVSGVPVPAGTHRVELAHRAPGLRAGVAISAATLVLLVGLSARSRTTSGRPGRPSSSPPLTTPGTRRRTLRRPGRRPAGTRRTAAEAVATGAAPTPGRGP